MERFHYDFPMSAVCIGSVIPGMRQNIQAARIVSYPDGSTHPLITQRKSVDPMVKYPSMHQDHSAAHGFMEKLKSLLSGGGENALKGMMGGENKPLMNTGYQPLAENRDWRHA